MHTVLGFIEYLGMLGAEHLVRNLHLFDAELLINVLADRCLKVVEGRQAVEEYNLGVARLLKHIHRYAIRRKELNALFELSLFAHRYPNVRIDGICALNIVNVFGEADTGARLLGDLVHCLNKLFIGEKALGGNAYKLHAHLCRAYHE